MTKKVQQGKGGEDNEETKMVSITPIHRPNNTGRVDGSLAN